MPRGILLRVYFDCLRQRPFELPHCLVSINGVLGQSFEAHGFQGALEPGVEGSRPRRRFVLNSADEVHDRFAGESQAIREQFVQDHSEGIDIAPRTEQN
jgi:hypothetical protein